MEGCPLWTFFTVKPNISEVPGLIWAILSMIKYRIGVKAKSAHGAVAKSLELVISLVANRPGGRLLTIQG